MTPKSKAGKIKLRKPIEQAAAPSIETPDGVIVVVTQAFCPNGHNLVGRAEFRFNGYRGISIHVECGNWSGEVVLSPIHGDHTKYGMNPDIPEGTKCTLKCPVCKVELPKIADCSCDSQGDLVALYLRTWPKQGDMIAICNVLGCYRSRVMDDWEILSEYIDEE